MMIKECPVCNSEFEPRKISQVYCDKECRAEALREADKIRKRKEREEQRKIRDKNKVIQLKAKEKERGKEHQDILKTREQELNKRLKNDDPLAKMIVSNPKSLEYWKAYKQYAIKYAESWGRASKRTVNDISVYEFEFEEKVLASIEETGRIATNSV